MVIFAQQVILSFLDNSPTSSAPVVTRAGPRTRIASRCWRCFQITPLYGMLSRKEDNPECFKFCVINADPTTASPTFVRAWPADGTGEQRCVAGRENILQQRDSQVARHVRFWPIADVTMPENNCFPIPATVGRKRRFCAGKTCTRNPVG
jgi:hypothetical protein